MEALVAWYLLTRAIISTFAQNAATKAMTNSGDFARRGLKLNEWGRRTAIRRSIDTNASSNVENTIEACTQTVVISRLISVNLTDVKNTPVMQTSKSAMANANM